MWKRDQGMKPINGEPAVAGLPTYQPPSPVVSATPHPEPRQIERSVVNIGKSVVIKGELNGSEDLTIEGHVEGTIDLRENVLTIGPNGKIKANVFAKAVIVLGAVTGNITASEKIDIRDAGSVEGDLVSPRVAISEGAQFRGSVDMQRKAGHKVSQPSAVPAKPAQPPAVITPVAAAPATAH